MLNPCVAAAGEFLDGQRVFFVSDVKLLDPAANRPLWSKLRQSLSDLVAVDTVAAKIRTTTLRVLDATPRHDFFHHRGYIADLVILFGLANVKCLIVNQLTAGMKDGQERATDVLHMDKRAPRRTVARDQHLACSIGEPNQIVYYKVSSKAGGHTVGSGIAQVSGTEVVVSEM